MKCPKCRKGEIRAPGFANSRGLVVICDKCGVFFSFKEGSPLVEEERFTNKFWKKARENDSDPDNFDKEKFLKELRSQMPILEEFKK